MNNSRNLVLQIRANQPSNYLEMDGFINSLSANHWLALLGAYAAGGISCIVEFLKRTYPEELANWDNKDLCHYFYCRQLTKFKSKDERA